MDCSDIEDRRTCHNSIKLLLHIVHQAPPSTNFWILCIAYWLHQPNLQGKYLQAKHCRSRTTCLAQKHQKHELSQSSNCRTVPSLKLEQTQIRSLLISYAKSSRSRGY
ncbi:hypothetical protein KC19_10G134800 [Ceratodon purpureus]|uniref:Uncharacterized protein n=1 Tax=Ceratodon purpureus TaxID=3225 RepID=A0A8T0GQ80_CERPU|nr:hypothetical protein KC19_10G134800 [Ceratodon purpureus]